MSQEFNDYRVVFVRTDSGGIEKVKSYIRRSYADKCIFKLVEQGETVYVKFVQGGEFSSNRYDPIWYYHLKRSDGKHYVGKVKNRGSIRNLQEAAGSID